VGLAGGIEREPCGGNRVSTVTVEEWRCRAGGKQSHGIFQKKNPVASFVIVVANNGRTADEVAKTLSQIFVNDP
jgi:hypothetical protein